MVEIIPVDYITALLSFADVVFLIILFSIMKKVMKPFSEKHKMKVQFIHFDLAILLYFLFKITIILIPLYDLKEIYGVFIIPGLLLLASGYLVYSQTKIMLECCRRELNGI